MVKKNLLSVEMDLSSIWELGTTECRGIPMLFIALRSWTDFPPWPLGFLTGKTGIFPGLGLRLVIFSYGLNALKCSGVLVYMVLINAEQGFEESL